MIKTYLNKYIDGTYQDKCVLEIPFVIDDQYTWYRIIGSPLYDSNGILKVCVGSYKNITDIVKIREEDREKTKSIEILRESSIFSMNVNITQNIIYDMTGELSFNDSMLMSERSFSSFHYAAINDSILESDKEKFYNIVNRSNLEQYYKNNQCLVSFEYRRLLNGKPVWRKFSIYLQQATEDDDLFGYFFVSDIEAFKNKRSQIINFSGVFEDAACGVIRYDRDTNEIIAVNDEFAKILGYKNKSEIKDNFHNGVVDKVYEDDKRIIYEVSKGLINVGDSQNVEYREIGRAHV